VSGAKPLPAHPLPEKRARNPGRRALAIILPMEQPFSGRRNMAGDPARASRHQGSYFQDHSC